MGLGGYFVLFFFLLNVFSSKNRRLVIPVLGSRIFLKYFLACEIRKSGNAFNTEESNKPYWAILLLDKRKNSVPKCTISF